MLDLKNKHIAVIGLARTGSAVARACAERGAKVSVLEKSAPKDELFVRSLKDIGINLFFGEHDPQTLLDVDAVVPSPGISPNTPIIKLAAAMGISIISEIELASLITDVPIIAVTGTNGKTTTTCLIGAILASGGLNAQVCGNIGRPMIEAAASSVQADVLAVEVSSFQLEFVETFKPKIAVLLNLTPDHLDWHTDFNDYRAAKLKIFQRQTDKDWMVIGEKSDVLLDGCTSQRRFIGGRPGVFTDGGWMTHDIRGKDVKIMPVDELPIPGRHNLSNAMAAAAACLIEGVEESAIRQALKAFPGVEHRLERTAAASGVLFYNDSKATNPEATMRAVESFDTGIILLAGGRNKGNSFDELAVLSAGRVKTAVLFGEAAPDLSAAFGRHSIKNITVGSFRESIGRAIKEASPGDIVLLSPACASYDMFTDFEERGRRFKEIVFEEVGCGYKSKA